jgi:hypothetical protein
MIISITSIVQTVILNRYLIKFLEATLRESKITRDQDLILAPKNHQTERRF